MADETQQLETEVKEKILSETPFGTDNDILDSISGMFSGKAKQSGVVEDDEDGTIVIEDEQQISNLLSDDKKQNNANTTSSKSTQQKQQQKTDEEDGNNGEEDDESDPLDEDDKGNVKVKRDVFNSGKKTQTPVTEKTLLPVLSKTFNVDLEEEGGAEKLVKSINKIRTQAQQYEKLNEEVTEYKEFLGGLPQKLKAAMLAFNKGEDWESHLGTNADTIDYNADFGKIADDKKVEVINKLMGGTFKEIKDIPVVTLNAVKNIFATQKQLAVQQADVIKQKTASQKAMFDSALETSLEEFKSENPDFDKVFIRNMAKKLQSGEFKNYFFDKNGNPHKQAIKRLTHAVVGEERIKQLEAELASLKGSKKVVEKVAKQSGQPVIKKQANTKDTPLPKEVEAEVSGLVDLLKGTKLTY